MNQKGCENMTFGEKLRAVRKEQKITQEKLAELLNVSTQCISGWECGKNYPSADRLEYIAEVLNTSVGYLMDSTYPTRNWELRDEMFTVTNMYIHVLNQICLHNLTQSKDALPLMMKLHEKHVRTGRSDIPYVSHPLMIAWHAFAMGIKEDDVIATILLHGIYRNCDIAPEELPITLNDNVRSALHLLHFKIIPSEPIAATKKRYYEALKTNQLSCIVRSIDQCNKISTVAIGFPKEKLYGYIEDTELYVLPLLSHMETTYLDYYNIAFLLKYQILSILESLKRTLN